MKQGLAGPARGGGDAAARARLAQATRGIARKHAPFVPAHLRQESADHALAAQRVRLAPALGRAAARGGGARARLRLGAAGLLVARLRGAARCESSAGRAG